MKGERGITAALALMFTGILTCGGAEEWVRFSRDGSQVIVDAEDKR